MARLDPFGREELVLRGQQFFDALNREDRVDAECCICLVRSFGQEHYSWLNRPSEFGQAVREMRRLYRLRFGEEACF